MYICSQSGELVHPIHLQHLVEEQQENDEAENPAAAAPANSLERGDPVHSN
jgi:hypothetical protein